MRGVDIVEHRRQFLDTPRDPPDGSPIWNDTTFGFFVMVRRTWPGSNSSTPTPPPTTQPTVRPQPTTPAIRSSLIQFCDDTTKPPGARYCRSSRAAQTVSYDFTAMNAMSIGRCFASACTSVMCIAFTRTVWFSGPDMP